MNQEQNDIRADAEPIEQSPAEKKTEVIGVRFRRAGKVYYFDPRGIDFEAGDGAIVETVRGVEYGDVVMPRRTISDGENTKTLKPVIRKADAQDTAHAQDNARREKEAFALCEKKIAAHNMQMKLISVEYAFENNKIVFYFTADGRVDFRELVKDLASVFKTRIELRQIGVRDETRMLGGLGPCGRPACCSVFLGDFQPVSIKMAKDQSLSLSPTKISGLCGRLMCCLGYEHNYYKEVRGLLPRAGAEVMTPDGSGVAADINVLTQRVKVRVTLPDGTIDLREYAGSEVKVTREARPRAKEQRAPEPTPAETEE